MTAKENIWKIAKAKNEITKSKQRMVEAERRRAKWRRKKQLREKDLAESRTMLADIKAKMEESIRMISEM